MCGIFGIASPAGRLADCGDALRTMRDALRHRGPDGDGLARSPRAAVGATRLRVVDLDPRADQPFADPASAVLLACNGEIYNAPDLRRRFAHYPFRSRSDVETLLPLYLERGAVGLADAVGMFAIAIWDEPRGRLTLARDRAGEKPLFWAAHAGAVWFASEIGALLRAGVPGRPLDRVALAEYLRLGYVREPRTLHAGIRKVPAGTLLTMDATGANAVRYWDPAPPAAPSRAHPVSSMRELLAAAVTRQLTADVPVGVFTSGGLDSSLLATLATRVLGADRVHTFAVGFGRRTFDERPWARRLSARLGTPHHETEMPDHAVLGALDALARSGEPLSDPAAVPTWWLAREARERVTVVLSGEGGDELFGGYPTYLGHHWAGAYARLPGPLRAALAAAVRELPASRGRMPLGFLLGQFTGAAELPWSARHATWFGSGLPPDVVGGGEDGWGVAGRGVQGRNSGGPGAEGWDIAGARGRVDDVVAAAMRLDYGTALRERLLVKVDRATMRCALEARAPFLDPAVTRAALGGPGSAHVSRFRTKRLLRDVARGIVPGFILRRRKRGLTAPVAHWLADPGLAPMLEVCRDLPGLTGGLVAERGMNRLLADPAARARHGRGLWTLLVLRHWMRLWNLEGG